MRLGIGEVFEHGLKLEGQERIDFFRNNWTATMGNLIKYAIDPWYVWDLPEGNPPYNENKYLDQESNLYSEARRLYMFFAGNPNIEKHGAHVPPLKKEINFIAMLEGVAPLDAQFLLTIKNKKLPGDLTALDIQDIYPGLLRAELLVEPAPVETGNVPKPAKPKASTGAKKPAAKKKPVKKKATTRKPAAGSKRPSTRKAKEE